MSRERIPDESTIESAVRSADAPTESPPRRFEHLFAVYPCVVQSWDISSVEPGPKHPTFSFDTITSSDDPRIARLDTPDVLRRTLEYGHQLAVVFEGDEFVGRGTISTSSLRVSPYPSRPGVKLKLGPGEVWASDIYTLPLHRRRGVSQFWFQNLAARLRADGHRRIVLAIEDWNEASLAMAAGVGFRTVQRLDYLRVLGLLGTAIPWSMQPRNGPMSL